MNGPRPSELLSNMPTQFSVRTQAEEWKGAFEQARGHIREQGEVMSAALTNNKSLWETNKKLRVLNQTLTETCARLEHERNVLQKAFDEIPDDVKDRIELQLQNEKLIATNRFLAEQLTASVIPELNTEQRRSELARVVAQQEELKKTGLIPTEAELALNDYQRDAQPTPFLLGQQLPGVAPKR